MSDFVHLHNHSDFSLLDGAASISGMVSRASEFGMKHLALTDHGNMFGVLPFYKECRKAGINPILGCEFYVSPGSRLVKSGSEHGNKYYHLVLLARDNTGYQNLLSLASLAYTEGFYYKPRIDDEILEQYAGGLVASTACLAGEIPQNILRGNNDEALKKALYYRELFGKEHFYLELQDHGIDDQRIVNRELVKMSARTGIPLIATNDAHYVNRADANAQDILICIGTNKKKNEINRMKFEGSEFYLKSPQEMFELFREVPEALTNTVAAAEQCNLEVKLPGPILPDYVIPAEFSSPEEYLRHLTMEGVRQRYGGITPQLKERAEYELGIIISMGFTGYFLIVWDFIHWSHKHGIPVGPGRGSGAGSIVAYALKITDIDPLKYNLLFERFLNPERVSMPDFDIDFCFERRQEVIEYVTRKYGKDRVGQIITFGTLKAKAVIKDVARVLDIPFAESNEISKLVPEGPKVKLKDALSQEPKFRELEERGGVYSELIDTSKRLEGLARHCSTHAAGIVIGKEPLTRYVPLYRDAKTGSITTQYDKDLLEECGLVKMDFLGLKTLTLIRNTEELIRKRGLEFDINTVSETDPATYELLGDGRSTCVFQFESTGMQGILKRAKPNSIEDLIALNALYRPGPMQFIDQFIDSKLGRTPITYPLPELKEILEETYGVIVYQEQVMQIAQVVGGYSLGGADILRRAMGKKKVEVMDKEKVKFVAGAAKKGYSEKDAVRIFDLLIPFAGYGFNKSHAAAYSVLAYKTAYLKANFPAEFMAANLTNEITSPDKLAEYITESKNLDIAILPPDINLSEKYFTVVDGQIVYGLMGIKNVGTAAVDEIVAQRADEPYTGFRDFLERVDLKIVNRKVIETLIQTGCFDKVENGRAILFENLELVMDFVIRQKESAKFGQVSLFGEEEHAEIYKIEMEPAEEWPQMEILGFEKELLGFYFSGYPLDDLRSTWEKTVTLDLTHPERATPDKVYTILGIVKNFRQIITAKGKPMAFALVEDFNGAIELVLFPRVWEEYQHLIAGDAILGFQGKVDQSRGKISFLVDKILLPEELKETEPTEIHIRITGAIRDEDELVNIRNIMIEHKGRCNVFLHFQNHRTANEYIMKVSTQLQVSGQADVLEEFREQPQIEEVWKE